MAGLPSCWEKTPWDTIHCLQSASETGQELKSAPQLWKRAARLWLLLKISVCGVSFQSLNRHLSCSDVFGPWELLDTLNKENQELGLIIDLTFTTRYYKIQVINHRLAGRFSWHFGDINYYMHCFFVCRMFQRQ